MSTEDPSERLARLTREALAREARERGAVPGGRRRPEPGDLFLLPLTDDLPVEWAVLERHPDDPRLLYAVPADTSPLAGSSDLAIPAGSPAGPLSLRLAHGAWLDESHFEADLRAGALGAEDLARAQSLRTALESGTGPSSARAREVDADPEYQDWMREVVARAQEAASRRPPERARVGQAARPHFAWALAATFFLATVGLSLWVAMLENTDGREVEPELFAGIPEEVVLGGATRGSVAVRAQEGATFWVLALTLDVGAPQAEAYQMEIVDPAGRPVWTSTRLEATPPADFTLMMPRSRLAGGRYRVRLYGLSGDEARVLDEQDVRFEAKPPPR